MTIEFYYLLALWMSTINSFNLSFEIGCGFLLFALTNTVSLLMYKLNSFFRIPLLVMHFTYYSAYFMRPFVLWEFPEYFKFIDILEATKESLSASVIQAAFAYLYIVIGFVLVTKLISFEKKIFVYGFKGYVKKHLNFIILGGIFFACLKIFLYLAFGIGAKGVANTSSLQFLQRLLPEDLFFICTILCLFVIRDQISKFKLLATVLVALFFSFGILMTGSKIFVMRMAFFYITYLIFYRIRIAVPLALILGSVGSFLVISSFVMSATMRAINVFGLEPTMENFIDVSVEKFSELEGVEILEMITERLNGLDGLLVVQDVLNFPNDYDMVSIERCFSLKEHFLRIIEMLTPMVEITDTVTTGVGVSIYIYKFPTDFMFAGAVGLVGTFTLNAGSPYLLPFTLMTYGAVLAFIFGFLKMLQLQHLRFTFCCIFSFFLVQVNIGGNFDTAVTEVTTKIITMIVYAMGIAFMRQLFKYY